MKMNIQSAINKEVFAPCGERLLVAVEVQRGRRKYRSFLSMRAKGDYTTFICVSVTKSKPHQVYITKVKQFGDSLFTRRSQWTVVELRQVNGINPQKDSPEFELTFDNTVDHWVASSAADKCVFVQVLYCACQTHWRNQSRGVGITATPDRNQKKVPHSENTTGPSESPGPTPVSRTLLARRKSFVPPKQTQFINCQAKLTRDAHRMNLAIYRCKAFLNRIKSKMGQGIVQGQDHPGQRHSGGMIRNTVQRMTGVLSERKNRLNRTEDKTVELMHKAQQLAHNAQKLALKYAK